MNSLTFSGSRYKSEIIAILTLRKALDLIGDGREIVHNKVVLKDFPPNFNSTYRPGYHWLYRYERDLVRQLFQDSSTLLGFKSKPK